MLTLALALRVLAQPVTQRLVKGRRRREGIDRECARFGVVKQLRRLARRLALLQERRPLVRIALVVRRVLFVIDLIRGVARLDAGFDRGRLLLRPDAFLELLLAERNRGSNVGLGQAGAGTFVFGCTR